MCACFMERLNHTDMELAMLDKLLVRNEGRLDRSLRVLLGAGLISLVFFGPQTGWGWVGLIPLVTGLIGSCPIYRLFGIATCPLDQR